MTAKRYRKLMRAFLTDVHTYSKQIEGTVGYNGKIMKRTSLKRENFPTHPNWEMVNSYEEAWEPFIEAWDSIRDSIKTAKAE